MKRNRRGAAVVEMSILMLILLPLIFYTLFLQDLLKYKLEQQEAIITPSWDFTFIPFQGQKFKRTEAAEAVSRANRMTFVDHNSQFNQYSKPCSDNDSDCSDTDHHQALAAHQCWVAAGADEVNCTMENANTAFSLGSGAFLAAFGGRGGYATCTARLGVYNKFVPQQIFTSAAGSSGPGLGAGSNSRKLMEKERQGDQTLQDLHGGSSGLSDGDQFFFNPASDKDQHFMLHDTWALTHLEEVDPDVGGYKAFSEPFQSRVMPVYMLYGVSYRRSRRQARSPATWPTTTCSTIPGSIYP